MYHVEKDNPVHPRGDYLVVWRSHGEVLQSQVNIGDLDPMSLDHVAWIGFAVHSEGQSKEDFANVLKQGFDLYLVIPFPPGFVV